MNVNNTHAIIRRACVSRSNKSLPSRLAQPVTVLFFSSPDFLIRFGFLSIRVFADQLEIRGFQCASFYCNERQLYGGGDVDDPLQRTSVKGRRGQEERSMAALGRS